MKKFGYIRLFKKDISFLHKLYFSVFGVSPDHKLRFYYLHKFLKKEKIYTKPMRCILDAGCGSGDYTFFFAEHFPSSNILSIDINESTILKNKILKEFTGIRNIEFRKLDIQSLDLKQKFDFICCIDVLEHIKNQRKVLNILYNVLQFEGCLFIHMPLSKAKPPILNKYLVDFHKWAEEEHVGSPQTKENFLKLLNECGFKIIYQQSSFNNYLGELSVSLIEVLFKNSFINIFFKTLLTPLTLLLIYLDIIIEEKPGNAIAVLLKR